MKTYSFATDSDSGTVEAETLQAAFDKLAGKISPEMIEDGATLWVRDEESMEAIRL